MHAQRLDDSLPGAPPADIAARYELPFAESAWLPDVIERHGTNPPLS